MPRLRPLLCAVAAASLQACYMPNPVAHATLKISAQGAFEFKGQAVDAAELATRITAARPQGSDLVVQIEASPQAATAAVHAAVAAVNAAHARVAFAAASAP